MGSLHLDFPVPLATSVRPGSLSPAPPVVGQGDSGLQMSRGMLSPLVSLSGCTSDTEAIVCTESVPLSSPCVAAAVMPEPPAVNVPEHSHSFHLQVAPNHRDATDMFGQPAQSGLCTFPSSLGLGDSVMQVPRGFKRSALTRSPSEYCLANPVAVGLDAKVSDCESDSCLQVTQGRRGNDPDEPFSFSRRPSRRRTLEGLVYAGSGGANPFHPDLTAHRLHDYRELANASAPVGLQLLAIPADGNCMFASIKAAVSNGLDRSPDAVMAFRQRCVDHLQLYTDLDQDHLQRLRRSGEWGDGYILQAAATLTRSRVQVWSPTWGSCFRAVSEAAPWDQDYISCLQRHSL